ncbi:Transposable element Hobo transposase [Frankliniella fusca]|uniref:Transposable element Hobo transposase n=1 Tax=Frankliniella fusca TaxID=407009 RepID=A0AAE1I4F5_9NEOP|nr:Transposable element Hobo transposase [Frankliniella fusca]
MKATGVNIRNAMFTAMAELGFTAEEFSGIEWVTDRGANIKKALENDSREDCTAHIINTVVRSTFTIPFYELRQEALGAASATTKKLLETVEEAVKVVRSADPSLVVEKDLDLKKVEDNLEVPNKQFSSKFTSMLRSVLTFRKQLENTKG